MSDFIPRLDRNSILCRDGSPRQKYTRYDITGIWLWKAEESLNYKKKKKFKAADITGRESRRVLMLAAKNNWFQRFEKEGIWRRVPFPCWPKAAAAEVISAGLPGLYHSIQKTALFFSLPRHVHYSWGQCLPCDSRNEVWFITGDVSIIDQTRGGVGSILLFGLGVVFCACRFSGSRVLYPIQLNRQDQVEPTMFVYLFCFFCLI